MEPQYPLKSHLQNLRQHLVEISEPTDDAETSSPTGGPPLESVSAPDAETLAPTNDSPPEAVSTPDDQTSALTNAPPSSYVSS